MASSGMNKVVSVCVVALKTKPSPCTRSSQNDVLPDRPTFVSFWDVKTAYDSVYRDRMFAMLYDYGVFGKMWNLLRAMFSDVRRTVRVGSAWSAEFGRVPQGLFH